MGQSKGYQQVSTVTPNQQNVLDQILNLAPGAFGQAQQGYAQFLPGGGGGESIARAAQQRFQQQTIPSIMNAFGTGAKSSSALNQALATGAANLNTDIASQLAQMQLQAAQGMAGLGGGAGSLGSQSQFALTPPQAPFWQELLLGLLNPIGQVGGAFLGR